MGDDKYADMPLEELAAKTLAMMGYERADEEHNPFVYIRGNSRLHVKNVCNKYMRHAFAAEVRGWMVSRKDEKGFYRWSYWDQFFIGTFANESHGGVEFRQLEGLPGCARYTNMDVHPRAVCIAALRATEKEAESDD